MMSGLQLVRDTRTMHGCGVKQRERRRVAIYPHTQKPFQKQLWSSLGAGIVYVLAKHLRPAFRTVVR